MLTDLIIIAIVLAIIGSIVRYLYRAKKRGETCIGCPYAKQCGSGCSSHGQSRVVLADKGKAK